MYAMYVQYNNHHDVMSDSDDLALNDSCNMCQQCAFVMESIKNMNTIRTTHTLGGKKKVI